MTAKSAALDSDTDFLFGLRRVGEELVKTWDFLNKPGISQKNLVKSQVEPGKKPGKTRFKTWFTTW